MLTTTSIPDYTSEVKPPLSGEAPPLVKCLKKSCDKGDGPNSLPPPPPILGVKLKKTTSEVVRAAVERRGGGKRAKVSEISKASIKNAKEILTNSEPELNSMLNCTYPTNWPTDGRIVKAHHLALNQAIERKLQGFNYFTAIEYQKRGAPHYHQANSHNLADFGEVVTLKRKKSGRRYPIFQTVKWVQDWAFETYLDIIRKPDPKYKGQQLEWPGLSQEDEQAMRKAYFEYNSGFSWEVMREKDGAKRYLVKELTGLKGYQKQIPDDIANPGRHFLYSHDMQFNDDDALIFLVSERELRGLLESIEWPYLPEKNRPLYKRLWNTAADLAIALIKAGYVPVQGSIEKLRKHADLRMQAFVDRSSETWQAINAWADLAYGVRVIEHWQAIKRRLVYDQRWAYVMARDGP